MSRRRTSIIVGAALSVLIHGLAIWLLIERSPLAIKPLPSGNEERIIVSLASPSSKSSSRSKIPVPANPEQKEKSLPHRSPHDDAPVGKAAPERKQIRKPVIARKTAPTITSKSAAIPQRDSARQEKPVPDDMFTQIQAARKRRADASAEERALQAGSGPPQEDESQRTNSIALANIAESLKSSKRPDRNDSGGVFQISHLGYHDAEFLFYGWSMNSRRNSSRLITVEQGANVDIQVAVVKRMIDIIREQKHDDFVWESHRLGKHITLSARPENSVELQQFLLREFFPDYTPSARG